MFIEMDHKPVRFSMIHKNYYTWTMFLIFLHVDIIDKIRSLKILPSIEIKNIKLLYSIPTSQTTSQLARG